MKYKVGDKVLIRQWTDMEKEYGLDADGDIDGPLTFTENMRKYCGATVEMDNFNERLFKVKGTGSRLPLFSIERKVIGMTKADLEDGMVCKTREGEVYVVFGELLKMYNGFIYIDGYDDELKLCLASSEYGDLDIVEVYETTGRSFSEMLDVEKYGTLIWKREEPKEMTLAEIEDALGYPVKIVKE